MTTARHAPLPTWLAIVVAVLAGPMMDSGFPDHNWWPLTFVGIGMLLVALIGRSARAALAVGFLAGVSFYLFHISWTAVYLGPVPWVALSILEALFFMVGGLLITLAYRWVPRAWPTALGRFGLLPVVVAGLWTAREGFVSVWPYGGFPWGRVALSQSQSPFAPLVAWFGISGLSFVMVWLVAFVLVCAFETRAFETRAFETRAMRTSALETSVRVSSRAVMAIASAAIILAIPAWPAPTSGTVAIGAVQGNGPAGYFQGASPGDVMDTQTSATLPLVGEKLDMVVWPEGAADVDPTRNSDSAAVLDYLSTKLKAPIITGTITSHDGNLYNTSLLWEANKGAVDAYDKKHLVPFGEYVPNRALWRMFAPDLIDLLQRDETPGTRDNVFDVNGITAGISICFDIADDQLLTDMMNGGAQVILAQTNNADFGTTKENVQQLAIARLRAIESARSLVNISTVGTSQIIDPTGKTVAHIRAYTPGTMVADVPLGTATTPAVLLSRQIELFVCGLGLGALIAAGFAGRSPRGRRRHD